MRSFLGFANHYWQVIHNYSSITVPHTDMLKNKMLWEWIDQYQKTFDWLKQAMQGAGARVVPIMSSCSTGKFVISISV
jgi:beta-galactosidase/beta-glucuronidase